MKTKAVRIPVGFYEDIKEFGERIQVKTFAEAFEWYMAYHFGELVIARYVVERYQQDITSLQQEIAYLRLPFYKKAWLKLKRWWWEEFWGGEKSED